VRRRQGTFELTEAGCLMSGSEAAPDQTSVLLDGFGGVSLAADRGYDGWRRNRGTAVPLGYISRVSDGVGGMGGSGLQLAGRRSA
jgi:hypothetical protein